MDLGGRSKDQLEQLTVISDRLKAFGCKSNHSKRKPIILGGQIRRMSEKRGF
jgi:hypothetical protein